MAIISPPKTLLALWVGSSPSSVTHYPYTRISSSPNRKRGPTGNDLGRTGRGSDCCGDACSAALQKRARVDSCTSTISVQWIRPSGLAPIDPTLYCRPIDAKSFTCLGPKWWLASLCATSCPQGGTKVMWHSHASTQIPVFLQ
jgi:hypothetical protein